jgi:hypothetical protein
MKRWHFERCKGPKPPKVQKTIVITCPHCRKASNPVLSGTHSAAGALGVMRKWHFDKCKHRKPMKINTCHICGATEPLHSQAGFKVTYTNHREGWVRKCIGWFCESHRRQGKDWAAEQLRQRILFEIYLEVGSKDDDLQCKSCDVLIQHYAELMAPPLN